MNKGGGERGESQTNAASLVLVLNGSMAMKTLPFMSLRNFPINQFDRFAIIAALRTLHIVITAFLRFEFLCSFVDVVVVVAGFEEINFEDKFES